LPAIRAEPVVAEPSTKGVSWPVAGSKRNSCEVPSELALQSSMRSVEGGRVSIVAQKRPEGEAPLSFAVAMVAGALAPAPVAAAVTAAAAAAAASAAKLKTVA